MTAWQHSSLILASRVTTGTELHPLFTVPTALAQICTLILLVQLLPEPTHHCTHCSLKKSK